MKIQDKDLKQMYYLMKKIRVFELNALDLFKKGELPGFLHSCLGQEASAVGSCYNLNKDDYITSTHRGHGHVIAKGAEVDKMYAELYAKKDGYCKAKGGSMHIFDFDLGILGANGIVGAGLPIANGAALASQLDETNQVTLSFFGDGASNEGFFHEALNLASVWDLPVVFICENNLYAESTSQRFHQKIEDVSVRAKAYGIPGKTIDGNDLLEVYETVSEAIERARNGEGPTLIECKTYRWLGHYVGDPGVYREEEEVEKWKKKDPVKLYKDYLLEEDLMSEDEINEINKKVEEEIKKAIEFAKNSEKPDVEEALNDVYV